MGASTQEAGAGDQGLFHRLRYLLRFILSFCGEKPICLVGYHFILTFALYDFYGLIVVFTYPVHMLFLFPLFYIPPLYCRRLSSFALASAYYYILSHVFYCAQFFAPVLLSFILLHTSLNLPFVFVFMIHQKLNPDFINAHLLLCTREDYSVMI